MKKLFFGSVFFLSIMASSASVNAQDIAFNRRSAIGVNPYPEAASKIVSEMDVNIKAVRHFKSNFKKASDVKWLQHDNGASVFFTNDGMKMRSTYNTNGRKIYTLKYFDESRMPFELRRLVKSNYYDHNIVIVTEVLGNEQTYHLVKMENEKEHLTLKIVDGEISIFEKISKRK